MVKTLAFWLWDLCSICQKGELLISTRQDKKTRPKRQGQVKVKDKHKKLKEKNEEIMLKDFLLFFFFSKL